MLRALLPNLIPSAQTIDVAWKWENAQLQLAIKSPAMAFHDRLPGGTTPDLCRRALEAEWANILNLGWFDIETSKDGQMLLLRSR